jgi:hypothetical protein
MKNAKPERVREQRIAMKSLEFLILILLFVKVAGDYRR